MRDNLNGQVSIPNGHPQPFSLLFSEYSMGSRQKQCFPRVSFLGAFCLQQRGHPLSSFLVEPPVVCPENLSVELSFLRLSEEWISLDHKQHLLGWRGPSHRFHFADTVRTQWIEPDTILSSNQVVGQF